MSESNSIVEMEVQAGRVIGSGSLEAHEENA